MAVSLLIEHSISISIMVVTLGWRDAVALGRTNPVALMRSVTHCTFISGFGVDAAIVSQSTVTCDRTFALFFPFSFAEVCRQGITPNLGYSAQSFRGPVLVRPVSFLFICASHVQVRTCCKQLKEIFPYSWKQAHSCFLRSHCTRR